MGKGVGARLLDWAQRRAEENGRPHLRLDCSIENPKLCAYYERLGFSLVGCFDGQSGYRAALYERVL
jgi:RimJ/RimL family protein N-acetyltransferase